MNATTNGDLPKLRPPGSKPIINAATLPPGGGRPLVMHIDTFVSQIQKYFSKLYLNCDEAYRQTKDHGASMRRDPIVMEPLRQRQLATALLDFQIVPEDEGDVIQKKVCEDLKLCMERTPYFIKMKMALLEAIWFGRYAVNMYGYHWDAHNPYRLLPGDWIPLHGDKLKFEHETGRVGLMITPMADLARNVDLRMDTESRVVMVPDEWLGRRDRQALIVHKHEIEDGEFFDAVSAGAIHGVGLRTRVYWPWYFKQKAVQWLMSWAEQVGLGVKIWYFEQSNPESEKAVRLAADQNNENMNILMPRSIGAEGQGAGLELLEPSSGGAQFLQDLADGYWGDQIKRMIVGQTLTSQTAPTGMGSEVGKQHRETFDQLVRYDALNLGETISREMLAVLVQYGYPGISWEPRFEFILEMDDPKDLMEAAKMFIDMGGEASEDEIRDIAGLKQPQKGEKVLGGKAALAAQQQAGMPPGGEPGDDGEQGPLDLDALAAEREGEPVRFEGKGPQHAPKGGITIHGKTYEGGEWIPGDVVDSMTDKQRAVLDAHSQPPGNAEPPLKDVPDGDYELREKGGESEGDGNKSKATKLAELVKASRSIPNSSDVREVAGETMTEAEVEEFMIAAGMDELNAADVLADIKRNPDGSIKTSKAVVNFKHRMHLLDIETATSDNLKAAKGAKVAVFKGEDDTKLMVHKSTRAPGKFQVTRLRTLDGTPDTPMGHSDHDSWDDAVKSISGNDPKGSYYNDGDGSYRLVQRFERDISDPTRISWSDFSDPLHFARRKPAKGQQSLAWDESEHPRDDEGEFVKKGTATATAEPDQPFSLENKPDKPTPKPAEPHKDASEQEHLFAGSDWKPGQEELFDPEGWEAEKPAYKVGQLVKFRLPHPTAPTGTMPVAGTIKRVMPDGRFEIKTQAHGYHIVGSEELSVTPKRLESERSTTDKLIDIAFLIGSGRVNTDIEFACFDVVGADGMRDFNQKMKTIKPEQLNEVWKLVRNTPAGKTLA